MSSDQNGGWVKLYWKTKKSSLYGNPLAMALWMHILLSTARKPKLLPNDELLKAGQCWLNIRELATEWKVGRKRIGKVIKLFQELDQIGQLKRTRKGTIFTVLNWDRYQPEAPQRESNGTAKGIERDRKGTHTESPLETKKPKEGERGGARPDCLETIEAYASDSNLPDYAEQFYDYHNAYGWKFQDWHAGYRNWCHKQKQFNKPAGDEPMDPEEMQRQRQKEIQQMLARRAKANAEREAFKKAGGESMADMLRQAKQQANGAT